MNKTLRYQNHILILLAGVFAFCIGLIHHNLFYPLDFHGDAASMHILAKAIFEEGHLLPKDFSYGNQLIIFRSSPFIALALYMGLNNYFAFILGSSLSIAFWGVILSYFLFLVFKSSKKALLFTICLLIPFGYWDSDFILGQQSHLSNVVLSLGIVISTYKFIEEKKFFYIIYMCACIFLMTAESPIRGLLVIAPLVFVILLVAVNLKQFLITKTIILLSFLVAFLTNKYLVIQRPISLNYFNSVTFKSPNEILENLGRTTLETLGNISSLKSISGTHLSIPGSLSFSFGLTLTILYFLLFFISSYKLFSKVKKLRLDQNKNVSDISGLDFLQLTAISSFFFGALAVAALNPDSSRHYLWVIFLGKLIILIWLFKIFCNFFSSKYSFLLLITFSFISSAWLASLVKLDWNIASHINSRNNSQAIKDIRKIAEDTGIKYIYGEDFWKMMPLNSLITDLNAQTLLSDGVNVRPFNWLIRPSWTCKENNVLYYLKDGGVVDKVILDKLKKNKSSLILLGTGYEIWIGPQVWLPLHSTSCSSSQLNYKGQALFELPSTAGISKNGNKITDGQSGFLIFGPHQPFKKGTYELTVYGSSKLSNGAYVDVVSSAGNVVHAKFQLFDLNNNFLLKEETVDILDNVSDIEVRVWVDKKTMLILNGYSLKIKDMKN